MLGVHGGSRLAGDHPAVQLGHGEPALPLPYGLEIYWEGKNLSNSISRTYLNGNPLLPWAPGQNTGGSESGVGYGYSAFGRTYVVGLSWRY